MIGEPRLNHINPRHRRLTSCGAGVQDCVTDSKEILACARMHRGYENSGRYSVTQRQCSRIAKHSWSVLSRFQIMIKSRNPKETEIY
jgi:hypothetical protein